jgi:hypothetical protein
MSDELRKRLLDMSHAQSMRLTMLHRQEPLIPHINTL